MLNAKVRQRKKWASHKQEEAFVAISLALWNAAIGQLGRREGEDEAVRINGRYSTHSPWAEYSVLEIEPPSISLANISRCLRCWWRLQCNLALEDFRAGKGILIVRSLICWQISQKYQRRDVKLKPGITWEACLAGGRSGILRSYLASDAGREAGRGWEKIGWNYTVLRYWYLNLGRVSEGSKYFRVCRMRCTISWIMDYFLELRNTPGH